MGRIGLAFNAFFQILFNRDRAEQIDRTLRSGVQAIEPPAEEKRGSEPAPVAPPKRSDALTLLETLQREARLIDFLQESIDSYSDEQVGAAVREVHRAAGDVLKRLFVVRPLVDATEGTTYEVTEEEESARIRLTGNVAGTRPVQGVLVHSGWMAEKCELPQWSGAEEHQWILAPAEVEVS